MIDNLKAKQYFKQYIKNYNPEDKKIALKIAHIERTAEVARKIAESLNLEQEDVELAELIGLLHDIGRFEQIKKYHTFMDKKSINHGGYGVKVLFEDGEIRNYIEDSQYDEIIKKAILNHNRGRIEEGLTERELLHAKIIRDADKTDIFYILTVDRIQTIYDKEDISEDKITDEIYREFKEDKVINYAEIKSAADSVVSHFAYLYDFYFAYGIQYIYENHYLDTYYQRFHFTDEKTQQRYEEIYEIAKKEVEKKIK